MNRTVRMTRRTLLCAVFACPLAFFSLRAAFGLLAAWTLGTALALRAQPPLWAKGKREGAALRRALDALFPALAFCAALGVISTRLLPQALHPAARALAALGGCLLQAALLLRPMRFHPSLRILLGVCAGLLFYLL